MNSHFETTDNLGRRAAYGLDYAIGYFLSVFETNADGEEMEVVALATGFGDNRGVILDKIIELQVGINSHHWDAIVMDEPLYPVEWYTLTARILGGGRENKGGIIVPRNSL